MIQWKLQLSYQGLFEWWLGDDLGMLLGIDHERMHTWSGYANTAPHVDENAPNAKKTLTEGSSSGYLAL